MSGREQFQPSAADSPALPHPLAIASTGASCLPTSTDVDDLMRVVGKSADADLLNGLIHELSQPLGALTNYAAVCLHYLADGTNDGEKETEVIEVVRRIAEQARRANEITKRLKSLIPGEDLELTEVNINSLVEEVVSALGSHRRLLDVDVQFNLEDRLPKIATDRARLMQVVAAILKNAGEAVCGNRPGCRRVAIGTRRLDAATVEITVEDSGPGLECKDLDLVFSPSYTTKPGRLGLGLPISRSVIETLGGRLEAASVPESGALQRIVLPIQPKELNVDY